MLSPSPDFSCLLTHPSHLARMFSISLSLGDKFSEREKSLAYELRMINDSKTVIDGGDDDCRKREKLSELENHFVLDL